MARLSPQGKFRALDSNGDPLSGGKLYTYEAGTSTPKTTYTTEDESVANANPVILDSNGYADVWLASGSYKLVLTDSADVTQWTVDDVSGSGAEGYGSAVVTQASNLNLTTAYENNLIIATAGINIDLLAASAAREGFLFTLKNTSSAAVTVDPDAAETIDGNATYTLNPGGSVNIVCDGSNWQTFGGDVASSLTAATVAADDKIIIQDTDAANGLKTATAQSIADLAGSGKILQVVEASFNKVDATSATYVDVMSQSFTPVSDTSKVLLIAFTSYGNSGGSSSILGDMKFVRDASDLKTYLEVASTNAAIGQHLTLFHLDTPGVDTAVTYKLQGNNTSATQTISYNSDVRGTGNTTAGANMLLVEIEI